MLGICCDCLITEGVSADISRQLFPGFALNFIVVTVTVNRIGAA